MEIGFEDSRPASAEIIGFIMGKDEIDNFDFPLDNPEFARRTAKEAKFKGSDGQSFLFFAEQGGESVRIVVLGVGDGDTLSYEKAGGTLISKVQTCGAKTIALHTENLTGIQAASAAYGVKTKNWRMDTYRTKLPKSQKPTIEKLVVVGANTESKTAWPEMAAVADGVMLTRELVAEPANIIYPETFVERCEHLKELGVKVTVLGDEEMEKLGMGALLGVSQGSIRPARLLVMHWDGTNGAQERPIAFVGKGVTFDTGGISIKPAGGMEDMKWDMGGAGAVAGAMKALAGRKAKANVVGVCGLVENMPDGNAQRPGDVVTSMSGQTIEVINTDAEGRLVLCDALHWTQETYNPEYIVDLATLTGAIIISLAHEYAGLFSNSEELCDKLLASAETSGDALWRFPIGKAYDKMINSPIADMKNVGPRGGGSITAAQFLHRFIQKDVKWAHLDIAGMAWDDKAGPTYAKGATGYGVKLLNNLIAENFEV